MSESKDLDVQNSSAGSRMRKAKLVLHKSFVEIPTIKDTFAAEIEFYVPEHFDAIHLAGARIYDSEATPEGNRLQPPHGDVNATIIGYQDVQRLVGKLLTYIDATYTDQEQRKAHKDLVKESVHGWHEEMRIRGVQTVDAHDDNGHGMRYKYQTETYTRVQ